MLTSQNRLRGDLERWIAKGWVTPGGAEAIRAELAARRGPGLAGTLAVLAAVLLGFSAMSFVAANWQGLSKLMRLLLLGAGLWGAYGLAVALAARGLQRFAEAAVLAGVAIFGASIMLISQMYHIEGNPPEAVLLWALGALLAGVLLRSVTALTAAAGLALLWSAWMMTLGGSVHFAFLPLWAAIALAFHWLGAASGLHISLATLAGWLITGVVALAIDRGIYTGYTTHCAVLSLIGTAGVVGAAMVADRMPRLRAAAAVAAGYASLVAFWGLWMLQLLEPRADLVRLIVLAAITLAMLVALVAWGWRSGQRALVWLGYAGFSIEILFLYFRTLGTLLNTSLFFLVASLIVTCLAALALRLHRHGQSTPETRP